MYARKKQKVTLVELCILELARHLVFFHQSAGRGTHIVYAFASNWPAGADMDCMCAGRWSHRSVVGDVPPLTGVPFADRLSEIPEPELAHRLWLCIDRHVLQVKYLLRSIALCCSTLLQPLHPAAMITVTCKSNKLYKLLLSWCAKLVWPSYEQKSLGLAH